jgi:hypothetical protein
MGTDWVNLFDLDLAKAVIRLDARGLGRFLAERGPALAERDARIARVRSAELASDLARSAHSVKEQLARAGISLEPGAAPDDLADLTAPVDVTQLEEGEVARAASRWREFAERLRLEKTIDECRVEVAWAAGSVSHDLYLDYWGCAAEVFTGKDDAFAICETNLVLEPDNPDGATVAFLGPPQVDRMIASLRAHWFKVRVMDDAGLQRLVGYRDRLLAERGLRVAYHIDY